jgi:hypothetical protein
MRRAMTMRKRPRKNEAMYQKLMTAYPAFKCLEGFEKYFRIAVLYDNENGASIFIYLLNYDGENATHYILANVSYISPVGYKQENYKDQVKQRYDGQNPACNVIVCRLDCNERAQ